MKNNLSRLFVGCCLAVIGVWLVGDSVRAATNKKPVNTNLRVQLDETDFVPKSRLGRLARFLGLRGSVSQELAPGTQFSVVSTGYAPSPYQTDDTPCITASGVRVRRGTVAANFLPLGTILKINEQIYIVEDRMNPRYDRAIDIFFPSTKEALEFGKQKLKIEVVSYGKPGADLLLAADKPKVEIGVNVPVGVSDVDEEPSALLEGIGKIWRTAGKFVSVRQETNVNRYDVDCFKEEAES